MLLSSSADQIAKRAPAQHGALDHRDAFDAGR
jgi:hypothetical protein